METLTKEQYEKLKEFEKDILAAYKNSFVHMTASNFRKVADIYAEITGTPLRQSQINCNTCRLNTLRRLGEMYASYTQEEEKKKKSNAGRKRKLTEEYYEAGKNKENNV